jgi:hypothetical protein
MFQGQSLTLLSRLPALLVMVTLVVCEAAPVQAAGPNLIFNYSNGFAGAGGAINVSASAVMNGSKIQLTPGTLPHEAGGAWYNTPVNIQAFTTNFTFQLPANGSMPSIQGITFCIQNSNGSTNPNFGGLPTHASSDANLAGYGAYVGQDSIGNSIAVKFDLNNYNQLSYPAGRHPNSTGLYINGGPQSILVAENDLNPYGIDLYSGHILSGTIVYDGSLLTMTLLDTTTKAQARYVWPINIPAVTSSDSAYVGFTGGEVTTAQQNLLTWSFSSGISSRLATPTFSILPGSYSSTQTVSITAPAGAQIYYTTNGLLPTSSSTPYTAPITVGTSEVIQAVAIEPNFTDSLVATGNYQIAAANSPVINFPNGFADASNLTMLVGYSTIAGSSIQLTDAAHIFEVGAAWYAAPVNVQKFATNFGLQFTSSNSNGTYGLGTTFTIQNQPATTSNSQYGVVSGGPTAIGNTNSALGYGHVTPGTATGTTGGLVSSLALKFDLSNNATGLYTGGALPTTGDVSITGVTLNSGHLLSVALTYDGTTLTMTITDPTTHASFSHGWTIDIPTTVGGHTAYVGFTAASGYFSANQDIKSWTYAASAQSSAAPAPPSAVPAPPTNLRVQ